MLVCCVSNCCLLFTVQQRLNSTTEEYAGHVLLGGDLARPCLGHPAFLGQTESGLFKMFSMRPDKHFGGPTVRQPDRRGATVMVIYTQYITL